MTTFKNILAATAASVAALAIASSASAQEYNGASGAAPSTSVTLGTQTSSTSGDLATCGSSTSTCTNTTTTVQNQVLNSSTAATTTGVSTTINGITYFGSKTVSGTGSQNQTVTGTLVEVYTPGNPPVIATSTPTTGSPVNVGTSSVTAVSATGFVGATPRYSSTLTTSGTPNSAGAVVATENETLLNSAGISFNQRIGTATYNAGTGQVTVALPTAATSSTSISATGISTTGSLSAAAGSLTSLNMNGGKITNLAAGTAATDAVNKGQLDSFQTTINGQISAFQTTINGQVSALTTLVHKFNKRLEGGIAVATALSGGAFLPDKKINITGNIGAYRGEVAGALQIGALISENVALNAGVATGFSSGAGTAFRGGFTFGF